MSGTGTKRTVWVLIAGIALLLAGFVLNKLNPPPLSDIQLRQMGLYLFQNPRALPDYQLLNEEGEAFTPESFKGQWDLVFFGFTFCPDVCPTTMATLKQAYDALPEAERESVRVVLVSVDPGRDTVQAMKSYVEHFDPSFAGVTGEFLDIHRLATGLSIPFAKVPGGGDNYQVDHSANIAVINPRGHYVGFFKSPHDPRRITQLTQALIQRED